ncbi:MAG: peroxiredoxin-like family protein [Burkholderiales bacterium]|nr:peroxiredoxin-like family protein [Burkholderiales bacterium]
MQTAERTLTPGEAAPQFELPAVNRDGTVSLGQFRGRRAVMLGFFRGLHCPFCRRQIAQLGAAQPRLLEHGVETLAVVNTPLERARLYFRHRPTPVALLSDPDCAVHRAYGVPRIGFLAPGSAEAPRWPTSTPPALFEAARIDPTGELDAPTQPMQANDLLNAKDGFALTDDDRRIFESHATQLAGQFLVDRAGIVRWAWIEAPDSPAELCSFPGVNAMVEAARALA